MICKKCGNEVQDYMKFCTVCGAPVEKPERKQAAPIMEGADYVPETPTAQIPLVQEPVYAEPIKPKKEKKPGKGAKIAASILAVVLVLILAAGAAGGYLGYREYEKLEDEKDLAEENYENLESKHEELSDRYAQLKEDNDQLSANLEQANSDLEEAQENFQQVSKNQQDFLLEYGKIEEEYDFYKQFGVYCSDMNDYYHTYDCQDWDREGFYLFNVDYAEAQNFTACPKCHK